MTNNGLPRLEISYIYIIVNRYILVAIETYRRVLQLAGTLAFKGFQFWTVGNEFVIFQLSSPERLQCGLCPRAP